MSNILRKLTTSQLFSFNSDLRSVLPDEQGLYIIYDCSEELPHPIRAGRTKSATGGLKQRVYANHLMGDQVGNLRHQLVADGKCPDLNSAKQWIKDHCGVRFIIVDNDAIRRWAEHYMLSIIRPRYCD